MNLPIDLKTRIYEHIGDVKKHLTELPADEQREILQALETHIHDALDARSNGDPDLDILEAIIAEMDPPESYGPAPLMARPNSTPLSPGRKIIFFSSVAILSILFIAIWLADPFASHWMSRDTQGSTSNQLIIEGAGLEDFLIGMTRSDLIQQHGAPQPNHPEWLMRWDTHPLMDVVVTGEGICREIRFNRGFNGATSAGIKLESPLEDACGIYGDPELVWTKNGCVIAEWLSKGIRLWTTDSHVTQIIVFKPKDLPRLPFKDDPAALGRWVAIDFVHSIDSFNPSQKSWSEALFLKELTFLPNGQTSSHWKWSNGRLRSGNTLSTYSIREIGGETYLFMEWMSGDVSRRGQSPSFYVLKREIKTPKQSPLVGKWTAIDFVSSISEFQPKRMYNVGGLELKGLEFLPDGKTDKPWWSWEDNQLFHSGDQSTGNVVVVNINRDDYLFMEWMSGDVLNAGQKPSYYVLKRGRHLNPDAPKTIIEGVGWEVFHLGATRQELIAEFGFPDSRNSAWMSWKDKQLACAVGDGDVGALQLNFGKGSRAVTAKGVGIGDSEDKAIKIYGNPTQISTPSGRRIPNKTMTWLQHGIQIVFNDGKVVQIDIIQPQTP